MSSHARWPIWVFVLVASLVSQGSAQAGGRIGLSSDSRSFADLETGRRFVPRGVNYFHLHKGQPYDSFDTFDPGAFDRATVARDLSRIEKSGYNVVRTFLTGYLADRGFDRRDPGIPDDYVANIAEFLQAARARGLRVILTSAFGRSQDVPANFLAPPQGPAIASGANRLLLDPRYADALAAFYHHLLVAVRRVDPDATRAIMAVDLYNEAHFDLSAAPFDCLCGRFTFDGRTYDLSDLNERQKLADTATERWVRTVAAGVRDASPGTLITTSGFPGTAFGHDGFDGGRPVAKSADQPSPYPLRPAAIRAGGADYLDLHLYVYPAKDVRFPPAMHDDLGRIFAGLELDKLSGSAPILVGEIGAFRSLYTSPDEAVPELLATMAASCSFGVDGWIFWMWNGPGDTWSASDDDDRINRSIAPRERPDPCALPPAVPGRHTP